jgi:tRNA(Ile)-lysidine synthase
VLMRLLDGAGTRGLAGIPPRRGRVIRPLIETRRHTLRDALMAAGHDWVEDESNRDPKFLRNRIRHELLPLLAASYATDVVPSLARVARRAREAVDAVERTAADVLERLAMVEGDALTLPRRALAALPEPVAAEALRQAAARLGSRAPLRAWAHRGLHRILAPADPRRPFRLGGVTVEVSGDRVRVGSATPPPLPVRTLPVPGRVDLPEIGRVLQARVMPAAGYVLPRATPECVAFDAALLPPTITVRARRPGDRFVAFGGGARRLKSFLIDAKVPRWQRARVPLLEADGRILWVAGLRRGAAAPVTPDTRDVVEFHLIPSR